MTKIKFCGLTREADIVCANELCPEYIGFVFARASRRYIAPEKAAALKKKLDARILAAGVFVDEEPGTVAGLLNNAAIDIAQLHGGENREYIRRLRSLTDKPLIQAFRIDSPEDVKRAMDSAADFILLDAQGGGSGSVFDWGLVRDIGRKFFLAGGLDAGNAAKAIEELRPYALDVSSGIETDGYKDRNKMREFVSVVRGKDKTDDR